MNGCSRADLHVHSTASQLSKLGVQRSLALPECATSPQEVYELAKARGMDFVTITDHDTIAGAQALDHLPDTFISEELTCSFRGEPQAVHVLCYGITPDDHEWLQAHRSDVELCAMYLHDRDITAALAHPFYAVAAPLTARHRRRLARLFGIWETRNGSRAKELNLPAFVYIETHGGTAIGGSDDHAGIDVGRTFSETPRAFSPEEFLAHIRAGRATARGAQGSAEKWAHAAMGLAVRTLGAHRAEGPPDPRAVLEIAERLMREGNLRHGSAGEDLGPQDAVALLRAWLASVELDADEQRLLEMLQSGELAHADLGRRARGIHERRLAGAVRELLESAERNLAIDLGHAAARLFDAILPAVPYAAAAAFLGREKGKLNRAEGERPRVALIADGVGSMHGVTHTLAQVRELGVPGFDVEVIGTDPAVDRRLSAVAEIEVPFYEGLTVGVPSLPAIVEALAEGRYDLIHVCAPAAAGIEAVLLSRLLELPLVGSYHTELASYAGIRTGSAQLQALVSSAMAVFYGSCEIVLSPSPASDERLSGLGIAAGRVRRWSRGVELARFDPGLRDPALLPGEITVLHAGRLSAEKGVARLADAFLAAREREPRLHLVLAGGGPEEPWLRARLGEHATFLGWLGRGELERVYASADAFLFASDTDTFGQVVLEAQASGLPVVAVGEGGPATLIEPGRTGMLAAPDPRSLADTLLAVLGSHPLQEHLRREGLKAVRARTWERSLAQLAAGYRLALSAARTESGPMSIMPLAP